MTMPDDHQHRVIPLPLMTKSDMMEELLTKMAAQGWEHYQTITPPNWRNMWLCFRKCSGEHRD